MVSNKKEKDIKDIKDKKEEIIEKDGENINDQDLDKFDSEIGNDSRFMLILKFLKNFKFKIGSNVTSIQIPAVFVQPKSSISLFKEYYLDNFDLVLKCLDIDDSLERMCQIHRYTLSALHHVSVLDKPLNPILGETLIGNFHLIDDKNNIEEDNYYCTEQISHHPPIFTGCIYSKKHGVKINYTYNLNMLFMGGSVKCQCNGKTTINIEKFNETYEVGIPDLNVRFIRGFSEFTGETHLNSNKSNLKIISKHHSKPLIGGDYDQVNGHIINKETNEELYSLTGKWSSEMKIKNLKTKESNQYLKRSNPSIVKLNEDRSLPSDSNNIWKGVIDAHNEGNNKLKSTEKRKVENNQRQLVIERKNNNIDWTPKHFVKNEISGIWELINY